MKRLILMLGFAANYLIIFAQQPHDPCAAIQSLRVVVIGSSTAAGSGASTADSAWVNRYRTHLQSINPANEVINIARGGYTTYQLMPSTFVPPTGRPAPDTARNITKAIYFSPDAIIVNLPSNDAARGYDASIQLPNFAAMHDSAAAHGIPLWVCTPQPRTLSPVGTAIQFEVRDSVLAIYGKYAIDFWTGFADSTGQMIPGINSGDNVHMNDVGHRGLFERVKAENLPRCLYDPGVGLDYVAFSPMIPDFLPCGDSSMQIVLPVGNIGQGDSLDVEVEMTVTDGVSTTTYTDTLVGGLATCGADTLTFHHNTYQGGGYQFSANISALNDRDTSNNRTLYQATFSGHPTLMVADGTVCDSGNVLLQGITTPPDTIIWYDTPTGGNPFAYGSLFLTPPLTTTQTYYATAVRGTLVYENSLLTTTQSNINWNGGMFDIIGHDSLSIDSLAIKVNSLGSQTVVVYQKPGTYRGSESTSLPWVQHAVLTVNVVSSDSLIVLRIPPIQLASGDTMGMYIHLMNSGSTLSYQSMGQPASRANSQIEVITGSGISHTFGQSYYPRDINVEVFYHHGFRPEGDCATPRMPVQANVNRVVIDLGQDRTVCAGDSLLANVPNASYQWSTGQTTSSIVLNQTDLYWLKATDIAGCEGTDTVLIIASPLPVFSLGPDTLACDSLTLGVTPFPGHSYLWSTGDTTPTISAFTSQHWLTTTDQQGCTFTDTINVTIATSPIVDLGPDIVLPVTDSIFSSLNPVPGLSYLWSTGSTNVLYIHGRDYGVGTHTVWLRVTGSNGCVGSDTILVTFTDVMGVAGSWENFGVKVYPNPTQGLATVVFPIDFPIPPTLYLYDLQGRELKHWHRQWIDKQRCILDLSALPSGAYVLRWQHLEMGQSSIYVLKE